MDVRAQRQERGKLCHFIEKLGLPDDAGQEVAAIHSIWRSAEMHRMGATIPVAPGLVRIITSGWVAWSRTLPDDRRIILLFLMPGDLIAAGIGDVASLDLVCLTPVRTMDAGPILDCSAPRAKEAILGCGQGHRLRLIDHMTRLASGCTESSLAHLLLELHDRLCTPDGDRFALPIGQRIIAQALGRSTVQINKSFHALRDKGLIDYGYDWARVLHKPELRAIGGFEPLCGTHMA